MDAIKLGDVVQAMVIGEVVGLEKTNAGIVRAELKITRIDKSVAFTTVDLDDVAPLPNEPDPAESTEYNPRESIA